MDWDAFFSGLQDSRRGGAIFAIIVTGAFLALIGLLMLEDVDVTAMVWWAISIFLLLSLAATLGLVLLRRMAGKQRRRRGIRFRSETRDDS